MQSVCSAGGLGQVRPAEQCFAWILLTETRMTSFAADYTFSLQRMVITEHPAFAVDITMQYYKSFQK